MDKLQNLLEKLYTNETYMLYFYIGLGVVALVLIVLIIITSFKAKKRTKNEEVAKEAPVTQNIDASAAPTPEASSLITEETITKETIKPEETVKEQEEAPVYLDKQEPIFTEPVLPETKITEPEIKPEEIIPESVLPEAKIEQNDYRKMDYTNDFFKEEKATITPEFIPNNGPEIKPIFPEEINEEVISMPLIEPQLPGKSISELIKEDTDFRPAPLSPVSIEPEKPVVKEIDVEIPKVKTIDEVIKEDVKEEKQPEFKTGEPIKTEETVKKEEPSRKQPTPEEIRARLASLKNQKEETLNKADDELEDIMKSVGLEDTMVIPGLRNEEKKILGK